MTGARIVVQAIEEAFADTPYPGDENIVADTSGTHLEAERIKSAFAGLHWHDVPVETLKENRSALAFFSAAGYAFYLPAFMRFAVDEFEAADVIPGELIFTLTPPEKLDLEALEAAAKQHAELQPLDSAEWAGVLDSLRGGYADDIFERFFADRVGRLDERQKRAVRLWLEFMRDEHGADFADSSPQRALERYWERV
jgi:uncharacterized protein DUF6714